MSAVSSLHKKWSRNADYRAAYDKLEPEFELARALVAARVSAGLTQAQLAKRMKTTQSVVARLEGGRVHPSTRTLGRVAQATGTRLRISFESSQAHGSLIDTNFVFLYFRVMKNVTVTLPEDAALWLRVRAAEQNRSVSSWLAEIIEGMRRQEDEYEVAMERFLARAREPRKLEWVDGRKPTREELHDRAGLR